ncbi:nucleoside recognition domain-containing protein, partial [Desulfococcus sp.]|uniref:nucleoside recognition domain-containing protein n=1 Tax=Desulfococcus sp. TaxID=2025834 RepID=UPI00359462A4
MLGFVPMIAFMFLGIAFLEDSGYLARMSFMLDRVFRIFGLHGSSVMAFILSGGIAGGCAVPGVMATRTLRSPRERLATLLTVPFMNCGAKMPVFLLLVGAFFTTDKALAMFLITIGAWLGALLVARLLRSTVIRGETTPFVMELPPYRLPTARGLLIHTVERTWQYIRKAGTVILGISVLLWALMTFPELPEDRVAAFDRLRADLAAVARAGEGAPTG